MLRQCGPTQSQPDRQPKRVVSMLKPVVLQQKVSALLLRMPEALLRIHVIVRKLTAKQPKPDALSAAQEETEKYRALYEELAGEESGTP